MMILKLSKRQLLTLILASSVNFFCATCYSLQAPFYPAEAEKKGATATEYGFVIGIYELIAFLSSPFFGKIIEKTGSKTILIVGMFVNSVAVIIFGFLDLINDRFNFILWSLVLRVVEALGTSSAVVANFAIMSSIFPKSIATVMSTLEMFYGLGFIVGPSVGGLLYSLGGFTLPFVFIGLSGVVVTSLIVFIPEVTDKCAASVQGKYMKALKEPSVAIDAGSTTIFALSQGFLTATLEPHLRIFNISAIVTSSMFVINGTAYAASSPIFGRIIEKTLQPKTMILIGCVLNIVGFSLIGPSPFLPTSIIPNTLTICIISLVLQGLATAAGIVSSFIDSIRSGIEMGLPADIGTYALMSGIWTSAYSLGAFIGPSVAGILYDLYGFQNATLLVVMLNTVLMVVLALNLWLRNRETRTRLKFLIGDPEEKNNIDDIFNNSDSANSNLMKNENSSKSDLINYGTL